MIAGFFNPKAIAVPDTHGPSDSSTGASSGPSGSRISLGMFSTGVGPFGGPSEPCGDPAGLPSASLTSGATAGPSGTTTELSGASAGGLSGASAGGLSGASAGGLSGALAGGLSGASAGELSGASAGGLSGAARLSDSSTCQSSSTFTPEQLEQFQVRYEGFDVYEDSDYLQWLEINHPDALPADRYSLQSVTQLSLTEHFSGVTPITPVASLVSQPSSSHCSDTS